MSRGHGHGSSSAGHEVLPRVERVETFEALADEWRALASTADGGVFSTWEWSDAWWRAFGAGRALALHAVRDDAGRLVAILPLCLERRAGLRVVRFVGHGPGDELGPVHRAGERATAAAALRHALADLRWDVATLEQLPGSVGWPELLEERPWRREASPALTVPAGGWETYLAGRSANFRQELRRRTRLLSRAGAVRFRLADEATLERDLDTLFTLHYARWEGRRTDFGDAAFHRDVARRALLRGWLRLRTLEFDDRAVAAWYGFQVGRIATYYQAGRDPAFDRYSVGTILLAHSIREAASDGALEYRFGRGAEPFKSRFAERDPGLETIVVARTARGRAALVSARAARPLRRLRRRLKPG